MKGTLHIDREASNLRNLHTLKHKRFAFVLKGGKICLGKHATIYLQYLTGHVGGHVGS